MNKRTLLLTLFRLSTALVLLTALSIVPVTQAAGAIIYVDMDATGTNNP
ncbi:MAG: hypothetical protein KAJ53_00245 [Anaerolineales bacterium]|nr:hypothetical protein [Anaerolineales bacterium]